MVSLLDKSILLSRYLISVQHLQCLRLMLTESPVPKSPKDNFWRVLENACTQQGYAGLPLPWP